AVVVVAFIVLLPFASPSPSAHGAQRAKAQVTARFAKPEAASVAPPEPLKLPEAQLEPVEWGALDAWPGDDHAAAFAAFLTRCKPLARAAAPQAGNRTLYAPLSHACR